MVEQRLARFQRDRHGTAVDLGHDVVGQIVERVVVLHPRDGVRAARAQGRARRPLQQRAGRAGHQRPDAARSRPIRTSKASSAGCAEQRREPMGLAPGTVRPQPPRQQSRRRDRAAARDQAAVRRRRMAAQRLPASTEPAPHLVDHAVARIAGEQFVAAVARQRHRHVRARHCATTRQVGICEGSANGSSNHFGRCGTTSRASRARDVELGVVGAEMGGDRLGVRRLVDSRVRKADRKRAHLAGRLRLHQRDHGRRIDAARQERAERHVGDHAAAHAVAQHGLELRRRLPARPKSDRTLAQRTSRRRQ